MFSGPFAVIFYSVDIYKNSGVQANDHVAAIISAAVRVGGKFKSSLNSLFISEPNSLGSLMKIGFVSHHNYIFRRNLVEHNY